MAYNKNNLVRLTPATLHGDFQLWSYKSADTFTTVKAANYISNALDMGMKVRDVVFVMDTTGPVTTIANILTVGASGATMSQTGVVIAE